MNYSTEISKSLTVLSEMLQARGKNASNLNQLSHKEVQAIVSSRNVFSIGTADDEILIMFDMSPKFKWADTKKIIESMSFGSKIPKPKLVIFVVKDAADVKKITDFELDYQVFGIKELQFNKATHCLVPKHELIESADEISVILSDYQLRTVTQLPLILKTDPMAKYFNARPGNVMKVTRISPTCGENVIYRCVA
jgi:DNA-directed RNA polymerase subunit H